MNKNNIIIYFIILNKNSHNLININIFKTFKMEEILNLLPDCNKQSPESGTGQLIKQFLFLRFANNYINN